jgi:hypothetical protein
VDENITLSPEVGEERHARQRYYRGTFRSGGFGDTRRVHACLLLDNHSQKQFAIVSAVSGRCDDQLRHSAPGKQTFSRRIGRFPSNVTSIPRRD